MFEEDYQYLPSLKEIRDGLIRAQNKQLDKEMEDWQDKSHFWRMKAAYQKQWKMLFKMDGLKDIEKPLTPQILSDPRHEITKHLLYLYSMESFIYPHLNRACREKNKEEIPYYGAFAAALSYII